MLGVMGNALRAVRARIAILASSICVLSLASATYSLTISPTHPRAVPLILLVQFPAKDVPVEINVPVLQYLASEIEDQGRVAPIVWGMTDPLFRAAVDDRILKSAPAIPSLPLAQDSAARLKAEYLLVMTVWQDGEIVKSRAQLYRHGKLVWSDPPKSNLGDSAQRNREVAAKIAKKQKRDLPPDDTTPLDPTVRVTVIGGSAIFSAENAARSVARTYATLLSGEPLSSLAAKPKHATPEPDQGSKPDLIDSTPIQTTGAQEALKQSEVLAGQGKTDEAQSLLRDAIDGAPFDLDLRKALIKLLIEKGMAELAAAEAARAAEVLSGGVELRVLAARCWQEAGMSERALQEANEALAREPENPSVMALRGELRLLAGDLPGATDSLDASIAKSPTSDALFARALARALAGNAPASKADLIQSDKLSPLADAFTLTRRYRMLASLAIPLAERAAKQTVDELTMARRDPKDPRLGGAAATLGALDALSGLLDVVAAPEQHKISQQRLLLALKLLTQSMSDLQGYLKTNDQETIADATMNMVEAMKALASAKDVFKSER